MIWYSPFLGGGGGASIFGAGTRLGDAPGVGDLPRLGVGDLASEVERVRSPLLVMLVSAWVYINGVSLKLYERLFATLTGGAM